MEDVVTYGVTVTLLVRTELLPQPDPVKVITAVPEKVLLQSTKPELLIVPAPEVIDHVPVPLYTEAL